MKRIYEMLVRLAIAIPHKPWTFDRHTADNRRATRLTINLIHELGIVPRQLVDVGAHKSEWARWIVKEWPAIRLDSFEPLRELTPQGCVRRFALTDDANEGSVCMVGGSSFHISPAGDQLVHAVRFDRIPFEVLRPSLLKIDCENYTARALRGFGDRINEFAVVVVEMWNDYKTDPFLNQQADIWEFMLDHGFRQCRAVDSFYSMDGIPSYDIAFYK